MLLARWQRCDCYCHHFTYRFECTQIHTDLAHNACAVWCGTSPHDHNPHDRFPFLGNNYTFISILENFLSHTCTRREVTSLHALAHTHTHTHVAFCAAISMHGMRASISRIIVFFYRTIDIVVACGDVYRFTLRRCRSHGSTHTHTALTAEQCGIRYTHLSSNSKVNEFSDNLQHIAFQKSCSI